MSQLTTLFSNIATAIRSKTGETGQIPAANFPAAISNISGATFGHTSITGGGRTLTIPALVGKNNVCVAFMGAGGETSGLCCLNFAVSVSEGYNSAFLIAGSEYTAYAQGTWNAATGTYTVGNPRKFLSGIYAYVGW